MLKILIIFIFSISLNAELIEIQDSNSTYRLSGKVMTEDSVGIPNVPIVLTAYIPFEAKLDPIFTDKEGKYTSPPFPFDTKLIIELPEPNFQRRYEPDYTNLRLKSDSIHNIIMKTPKNYYSVSGIIYDNEEPIPGFFIEINSDYGDTLIQGNSEGMYLIENVPEGRLTIYEPSFYDHFIKTSIIPDWHIIELQSDTSGFDFNLDDRISKGYFFINGKVTLNGEVVSNVKINQNSGVDIYTDENGYYFTRLFNKLFGLELTISVDSIQNGIKYQVTPKEYIIKTSDYENDILNIDFELSPVTSVESFEGSPIIYPNPTSNYVNIDISEPTVIELFDLLGNKLLEEFDTKLDISQLKPGTYYLKYFGQVRMVVKI